VITDDKNFRLLYDTNTFILGNVFERVYLINKRSYFENCLGEMYGDPEWGLVSSNNDWAIVGGQSLILWSEPNYIVHIEDKELIGSVRARQVSPFELEMLIDPWADNTAVWLFNTDTLLMRKVTARNKLSSEYTEEIIW